MTSKFQELLTNLEVLHLDKMHAYLSEYIDQINAQQLSFTDAMLSLTTAELNWQSDQEIERIVRRARFPQQKTLKAFDFDFQPNINKQEVLGFQDLAFMEKRENLVFIGSPGVGKTHLAISIGIEACRQGKRTLFINCHELLSRLRAAYEKGDLDRSINRYARYDLLVIDEIGYLPIDHDEANLLFQLINARYEKNSTIITSNTDLSGWVEIFQNPTVTGAILDRVVHHVHVVKITGKSYRLKGTD
ncbi:MULTISPECIES: IS21-like element helper ATPase IstB [Lactobacillaceae]|jgi:DNA replication protein DnaC|uniref:Helper protein n=2 Tax=Secundilactobacillus similis TaxID=414682 RepID=A0A0R2F6Q1_9LACO|nr:MULTISPECIES: IS21-like element helper ATPase IstB [Lactobacillaceae]KRN24128.1 helper protein [Secundilactobacillus similis DSM 23365 = JCM 2765]MCS8588403.1 AAA family ATPase [Lactiplantibacillus plantarum]MDV3525966.1 IS21-like element helper ATPase IstB [Lactiplantibacillus plantarum]